MMLFSDLYIGVPPGQKYPDFTEIIYLNSSLASKDMSLDGSMKVELNSTVNKEINLDGRIYN